MPPLLRTSIFRFRTICLRHSTTRLLTTHSRQTTFESLGVNKTVVHGVQEAFPNIHHPTLAQEDYIPAVLNGKDVLLNGQTGSGKSFGLLLALLSLKRGFAYNISNGKDAANRQKKPLIGSLVLTPHRDLAYQFMHWIRSILAATSGAPAPPLDALAQVLLRGAPAGVAEQVARVHAHPPHILIGTPQAVLEALSLATPLDLRGISAVVVDEADYMLESAHKKVIGKHAQLRAAKKLEMHPSPARQILDHIYGPPDKKGMAGKEAIGEKAKKPSVLLPGQPFVPRPQLILSTATLRAHFRASVMREGWLTQTHGDLVKVKQSDLVVNETTAVGTLGGTAIQHCALVVADDGSVTNIAGATEPIIAETNDTVLQPDSTASASLSASLSEDAPLAVDPYSEGISQEEIAKYAAQPSPFNQAALEAIGVAFALDVPKVALLVLPAEASVWRVVFDLRTLGINAHGLDVLDTERGGAHLLQKGTAPEANPTLLVATLATMRGLDLPDLTHVFMLGIPRSLTADAYLHVAGRVGRFGKSGKMIAVLEPRHEVLKERGQGRTKIGFKDEPGWLKKIYQQIEVTPTKFEHFGDAEEGAEGDEDVSSRDRDAEDKPALKTA